MSEREGSLKKSTKKWLILGAGGLVAVAAVVFLLFLFIGESGTNYSLYLKDNEMFFDDLSQGDPMEITKNLLGDSDKDLGKSAQDYASTLSRHLKLSDNGKILFFPDRAGDKISSTITLYYRDLTNPDKNAKKIADQVSAYSVNKGATVVTCISGSSGGSDYGNLYQYDLKKDYLKKLASGVSAYWVSDDGEKLYYVNDSGVLYEYISDTDK